MNITREQAICMFFSEECNEQNVTRLSKKIEDFRGVDVCYENDPKKPVLVTVSRILADPFTYKRYITSCSKSSSNGKIDEKPELKSELQVLQFINVVYLPTIPLNASAYDLKFTSIQEVFNIVNLYTDCMLNKSVQAFATWCQKRKAHVMNAPVSRKRQKIEEETSSIRGREIYVLKDKYLDKVAEAIVKYTPQYQKHINNLKNQSYEIIGYARKSPGNETDTNRIELLRRMVQCLKSRSLVDSIFISPYCLASDTLASRDLGEKANLLKELQEVDGNIQDLINHLDTTDNDICLVAIDFAGLSTNCDDLKHFISKHTKLKKIIIDQLPFKNEVKIFDREELLENSSVLSLFDCRTQTLSRSKEI